MLELKNKLPDLYSKIAVGYLALSLILVGLVFNFSLGRLTVFITVQSERVSHDFIVEVKAVPAGIEPAGATIPGRLFELNLNQTQTFSSTGEQVLEDNVVGPVTIINDYSRDQTLVRTTRLLAPDGTLLRTNEDIVVPAGSRREVLVYPDIPEAFEALGPTRFVIPGLWEGLQEHIYAENTDTLRREGVTIQLITQADIDQAQTDLTQALQSQIVSKIDDQLSSEEQLQTKVLTSDVVNTECDGAPGETKDEFNCTQTLAVQAVVFDEANLKRVARDKLQTNLAGNKQLASLNSVDLNYDLDKFSAAEGTASLTVKAVSRATVSGSSPLLDRSALVGQSEQQVRDYFLDFGEVSQVRFEYYPGWIRKIPSDINRISIEVE